MRWLSWLGMFLFGAFCAVFYLKRYAEKEASRVSADIQAQTDQIYAEIAEAEGKSA